MTADTSERGLERLICTAPAGHPCEPPAGDATREACAEYGGVGWIGGSWLDYDCEYCVDLAQLATFLHATLPEVAESLALAEDGPVRRRFLARLQGEITKRGAIDVLRHGIRHGAHELALFHGTPPPGNSQAWERFEQNRFTVTRQLRYSRDEPQRALDITLFINGLPVFTFELKNNLTRQTVDDAVWQYRRDRNPREKLFEIGRCIASLRGGRARGALLHRAEGQGVLVPPVQPRLERRHRQPAESERTQDGVPVARGTDPREPDRHHLREWRVNEWRI